MSEDKGREIPDIREGTVIDHIPSHATTKVMEILNLDGHNYVISMGNNLESNKMGKKGIIKVGGKFITEEEANKITIIAPTATVSIIKNFKVDKKMRLKLPKIIDKIIKCKNPNCITNVQNIETRFNVIKEEPLTIKCEYCERLMEADRSCTLDFVYSRAATV